MQISKPQLIQECWGSADKKIKVGERVGGRMGNVSCHGDVRFFHSDSQAVGAINP